jgi:hypothetical protein
VFISRFSGLVAGINGCFWPLWDLAFENIDSGKLSLIGSYASSINTPSEPVASGSGRSTHLDGSLFGRKRLYLTGRWE